MEAFDDVRFQCFPLFLVGMVVFVGDEVSVCSVEGEHQAMEFTVGGYGDLEVRVAE